LLLAAAAVGRITLVLAAAAVFCRLTELGLRLLVYLLNRTPSLLALAAMRQEQATQTHKPAVQILPHLD
jgi:hypothetical protein